MSKLRESPRQRKSRWLFPPVHYTTVLPVFPANKVTIIVKTLTELVDSGVLLGLGDL